LKFILEKAMKDLGENRGIALLHLSTRWGWVANTMPQPLYSQERAPETHHTGQPQGQSRWVQKIFIPHRDFIPRPPLKAAITNYTVPGHTQIWYFVRSAKIHNKARSHSL
jgi:hypothetical protein